MLGMSMYASTARAANASRWLRIQRISDQLLGACAAHVERDEGDDQDEEDERQRCGKRVVEDPQELAVDDLADHHGLGVAQQARVDEVTGRRDEGEQGT